MFAQRVLVRIPIFLFEELYTYTRFTISSMKFEFNSDGFDGLLDDLKTFELNCPECNHSIEVSLDDIGSIIKCPQCGIDIKLESE